MRFSLSLLATLLPLAAGQFHYPPPLTRPLSDYLSGAATSPLNFSVGDTLFGGWDTPSGLVSYLVYRCTSSSSSLSKTTTTTILPTNESFTNEAGHVSAADGTWMYMPGFTTPADSPFPNGVNYGHVNIWFYAEFPAPNATTGDMCWFELYPGREETMRVPPPPEVGGVYDAVNNVTVDGAGAFYHATVPFWVHPARPDGLTVTWKVGSSQNAGGRGAPTPNVLSNSSGDAQRIISEFNLPPQKGTHKGKKNSGLSISGETVGVLLSLMMALCIL
ncbi:hypothetical protein PWT90_04619 [Aphanocladium album]|nr:hypothetical protein PWT90_04619 [Aphanocladium album]